MSRQSLLWLRGRTIGALRAERHTMTSAEWTSCSACHELLCSRAFLFVVLVLRSAQHPQTRFCDSRTRGNHARGLKNSLHVVFTRYLRGNHVRYIYGIVLKYTVNTGESVFFLVVGGRRVFKFRVWCACLSLYSLFLSSRPFLSPCACAFSCSVHRHGPWLCAYRQVRNVTENFE